MNHPARENHRIIPLTINDSAWNLQYSPYVYYNEHCIVFNNQHTPMKIERATFRKCWISWACSPLFRGAATPTCPSLAGSILSHDHFRAATMVRWQGSVEKWVFPGFEDVDAGIVHWPMSCIRLTSEDDARLVELADKILTAWRGYSDEKCFIFAETDGEPHNTITPIARMRDGKYQLDLVLRNNITTPEHPLGVFHPHAKLHHIKKENIGLIEVMGLAVLPSRLKKELFELADALVARTPVSQYPEELQKHAEWAEDILARHPELNGDTVHLILQDEVGHVFAQVLADAGVYQMDEAGRAGFVRFLASVQSSIKKRSPPFPRRYALPTGDFYCSAEVPSRFQSRNTAQKSRLSCQSAQKAAFYRLISGAKSLAEGYSGRSSSFSRLCQTFWTSSLSSSASSSLPISFSWSGSVRRVAGQAPCQIRRRDLVAPPWLLTTAE